MDTLFGISMDTIMQVMLAVFIAVTGIVGFLAWRNRLFLKIGLRNIPRRRAQSTLIVFGLMLSTVIVTSAFAVGDTISYSIRSSGVSNLGTIDETVTRDSGAGGTVAGPNNVQVAHSSPIFFPAGMVSRIQAGLASSTDVDGVTGAIVESAPLQDLTSRQTEATTALQGVPVGYPLAFGSLVTTSGTTVTLSQLSANQAYLNQLAAQHLNAHPGDVLRLFVGGRPVSLVVRAILRTQGLAAGGLLARDIQSHPELLLPLDRAQRLAGHAGQVTHILVSNRGDRLSGATLTNAVKPQIQHALGSAGGYTVNPVKQQGLDSANWSGTVFTTEFVMFGLFSIAAGLMLIFLIFVMLAAERRSEMGMARAVGTKRRHLIQQFLFEGYVYDLGSALVGVILGIAVGLSLVTVIASVVQSAGLFEVQRHIEPHSVIVAFCLGALVTFITVAVSSWRVSRLNVVAAIRDLADDQRGDQSVAAAFARPWTDLTRAGRRLRRKRVVSGLAAILTAPWHLITAFRVFIGRGPLLLIAGGLLLNLGITDKQAFPFYLGISLLVIGGAMLLRWIMGSLHVADRIRNRVGYSLAGIALVIVWLLPFDFFRSDLHVGIEMFVLSGLMLTLGGVWTVMWNLDLLLGGLLGLGGAIGRIAPALKLAVTYPTQHRFRMGMTLVMFSLVIFALTVMSVLINSRSSQQLDSNQVIGGYDVYGSVSPSNPIHNISAQIATNANLRNRISAVGGLGQIPIDLREPGSPNHRWQGGSADIADNGYLASTHFTLHSRATGYTSDAQVWQTVRAHPGYAVVDSVLVRTTQGGGNGFQIQSFTRSDTTFKPTPVEMRDARNGRVIRLTVIGTVDDSSGYYTAAAGVYTGRSTLIAAHDVPPTSNVYLFRVAHGQNLHQTALALGSAFLTNGLDVKETQVEYQGSIALDVGIDNLLEGFMGLGLIVGIAALGVIATRSVVERRQQIGMLRAIGFRRRMVQASFLLESSIVAILGTLIGVGLGLVLSYQVVAYFNKTNPGLPFVIPWIEVGLILVAAYLASLLTTFLPAWQASRVYPAEALRYE
jgi:putative ABC transport system permease protein